MGRHRAAGKGHPRVTAGRRDLTDLGHQERELALQQALARISGLEAGRDLDQRRLDELEMWRAGMLQVLRDALAELGVTVSTPESATTPILRSYKGGKADEQAS